MSTPKAMYYKDKITKVFSIRRFIDLDYVSNEDFILIQWGSDPVKFACYVRKKRRPPYFLFSSRWDTKLSFNRIKLGYTHKPFNLTKFWRIAACAQPIDLDRYRHLPTRIRRISSTTGSQIQTKE